MKKLDFSKITKTVVRSLKKNSPAILTGIGVAGMIASTVTAVKATPKAMHLIEEKKDELNTVELTAKEIIQTTWKCYIPSVVTGVLSAGCIIFASSVNNKRNAALATAYSLSETALKDYKDSVIKTIGEEKAKKVEKEVSRKELERHPIENTEVVILNPDGDLCCDPISGRYFKTTINKIERAVNEINHTLNANDYAPLNDFYYEIGLKSTDIGSKLGWNVKDGMIEVGFDYDGDIEGHPCLVLNYRTRPKYDFDMYN